MMIRIFLSIILTIALSSCGFRHIKDEGVNSSEVSGQSGMTGTAIFSDIQNKIIGPKCLRCHSDSGGNQGSLNLESYDQVSRHLESIKMRSVVDSTMPPKSPLSNGDKAMLSSWITKELASNGTVLKEEKVKIKWNRIRNEIFMSKCFICHSPASAESTMEAGLDLTKIEVVREKADLIFNRIAIKADMPLKPFPSLTDTEKKLISHWMIDGMEDDEVEENK